MKKYLIYTGILLVLVSLLFIWLKEAKDNKAGSKHEPFTRERSGPVLKHEGMLFFLHPQNPDTIRSIQIEIVDTPNEIQKGLMHRNKMEDDEGMLFVFDEEEMQTFWMKNTRIPLDILFINRNLNIVHIAKHRIPYSTDPIPSMHPAKYVLEVNAGFCDTHHIESNDRIHFIHNYR